MDYMVIVGLIIGGAVLFEVMMVLTVAVCAHCSMIQTNIINQKVRPSSKYIKNLSIALLFSSFDDIQYLTSFLEVKLLIMIYGKQLYQTSTFNLPQIGTISLNPFPTHDTIYQPDHQKQQSIKKIFLQNKTQFNAHYSSYSSFFQQICAKQNLYPFMIASGEKKIAIVCRECIIICDWSYNDKGKIHEGGDQIIKLDKIERIKIAEVPTAIKVGKYSLYVGYQSGRISQYLFRTKNWEGVCDDLQFPIMQMEIVKQQQNKQVALITLDSAGNIAHIVFSHKTFMDKIIKTLSSLRWISFQFRNKKREKIKKIFKSIISNKQKQGSDTQSSSSQTVTQAPYFINKFHLKKMETHSILSTFRKNKLEIILLSDNYELIKVVPVQHHNQSDKNQDIAFIQLGEGAFQNSNVKHNILVLAINQSIYFYRLLQTEDTYEALSIAVVETKQKILFGYFISNSLLIIGNKISINLQNILQAPKAINPYDKSKFSYVDFFIDEQKLQIDQRIFNQNLISILNKPQNKEARYICLEGKRLIVGSICDWQTVLSKEIREEKWENCLYCYQSLYLGNFRLCCGINEDIAARNSQMKNICKIIVMGYFNHNEAILQPENKQSSIIISNIIYFLLKCDQSQLLFQQIQSFLALKELLDVFLQEICNFVTKSNGYKLKIPYMSDKILSKVIKKFKIKGQQHILQKLFMQFDLNLMQKLHLLTTCLRQQLYQSLIYICCQQKDYITPIIKLCGIRLTNPEKQGKIAQVIYWYLNECLNGRVTDYGNEADYINMLAILINFIFIPSSLEMLLQTSHSFLIQIINMFFQPRILRHILQNQDRFFMRKGEEGDPIFEENSLRQYRLYQKMLSILIKVIQSTPEKQREPFQLQLNRFLTSIMVKNQFPFLSTIKIRIILFYINHPFLFSQGEQMQLGQQSQVKMNGHLMRLLDSLLRSINQKCLYIKQKTREDSLATNQIEQIMQKSKNDELSRILDAIRISEYNMQFSQTKCYIYHQMGNYSEVLQIYLKMTNKKIRMRIFNYLQNNLRQQPKLTKQFLKYLISLLHIDQNKTWTLIQLLKSQWIDHEQIIDRLVDFPHIQLRYLQKIINSGNEKSKKLLLRHLQIVLRQKSDQVQYFINKIAYPLQEAFRMCQQRNNRKGKAFILIKSGRNMQGVMIITEIFLQAIQEYLRALFKKIQSQNEKKVRIMKQFQVVLDTCYKQWSIDNDRGEQIWEKITEIIFKKLNINNIDSQTIPDSIRAILNEIVTLLLSTMLQQVSPDFFLNRFVKTFSSLPLRIFTQAYSYIFQRIQFTFTLERLNKQLVRKNQIRKWDNILKYSYQGHICSLICNICNHPISTNQIMVSYHCNHTFHQQCYYEQNNKKNKNQLCPLCFNSIDSFMICNDNKPPRFRLQIDESELLKHKITKMSNYDRAALMIGRQQWSKYEDAIDS